jgi:hypothetical protein
VGPAVDVRIEHSLIDDHHSASEQPETKEKLQQKSRDITVHGPGPAPDVAASILRSYVRAVAMLLVSRRVREMLSSSVTCGFESA